MKEGVVAWEVSVRDFQAVGTERLYLLLLSQVQVKAMWYPKVTYNQKGFFRQAHCKEGWLHLLF